MNSESKVLVELWDLVRDHVPTGRRLDIAISFIRVFEEFGFDERDLQDIVDHDRYLGRAYDDLYGEDHDGESGDHYDGYEE